MKKSCVSLQRSVYFAPDEVRTCCQRFFVDGRMKGDVPLIHTNKLTAISYTDILKAKTKLLDDINSGKNDCCDGCHALVADEWPELSQEPLSVISIEDHSVCNMRCIYCSDVYYGGKRPLYDVFETLRSAPVESEALHLVWGGGEPTARRGFEEFFAQVNEFLMPRSQRVFTNALSYSDAIRNAVNSGHTSITVSVDAGTEATFRKIRGAKGLRKVLTNIQRYSEVFPRNVTIKYILTDGNEEYEELRSFVSAVDEFKLTRCSFLLSVNYKSEGISSESLNSLIYLYFRLNMIDAFSVTFDDHILNKIASFEKFVDSFFVSLDRDENSTELVDYVEAYIKLQTSKGIIVWGSGETARNFLTRLESSRVQLLKVRHVVDDQPERVGIGFQGFSVEAPNVIHSCDDLIVIASVNFYGEILSKLDLMRVDLKRVVPSFLL